jgi:hypothetical protein
MFARSPFVLNVPNLSLQTLLTNQSVDHLREKWTRALINQIGDETLKIYGFCHCSVRILGDVAEDKEVRLLEIEGTPDLKLEDEVAYVSCSPPPCFLYGKSNIKATFQLDYNWTEDIPQLKAIFKSVVFEKKTPKLKIEFTIFLSFCLS